MPETRYTGYHAVEETLKRGRVRGILYFCREPETERLRRLVSLARFKGIPVEMVEPHELSDLSGRQDHRGFLLLVQAGGNVQSGSARGKTKGAFAELRQTIDAIPGRTALVLLLDGITDPHNLGAILRSGDQFGADLVILPKRKSVHQTPVVARSSAGAHAHVRVSVVPNLVQAIDHMRKRGFWVYGADVAGDSVAELRLEGRIALVMGSEHTGIRHLVKQHCDSLVRIPACGHVDSFNVSVAAGILMYEVRRQQRFFD